MSEPSSDAALARAVVRVSGQVQGVGFRWWASRQAGRLGLVGHATNEWDGSVEVDCQGPPADVDALVEALTGARVPGRPGRVASWHVERRSPDAGLVGFETR